MCKGSRCIPVAWMGPRTPHRARSHLACMHPRCAAHESGAPGGSQEFIGSEFINSIRLAGKGGGCVGWGSLRLAGREMEVGGTPLVLFARPAGNKRNSHRF